MNTQTALQVTDFNFYGDNLIALKDNATGEIFTAINSVLRNIGFTERQVRHNRDKWMNDSIVSKGCQNFVIPDKNGNNQNTLCISNRKLPIALTKITITPKMKQNQPELASKLELYQDKCADVLASVFIDHQTVSDINIQPLADALTSVTNTLTTLTQTMTSMQQEINEIKKSQQKPKRRYSYWSSKMYSKYQLLTEYFQISNSELYKNLYIELQNMYPDIDLNQMVDDYCYKNNLDSAYTLNVIERDTTVRSLFEDMVNNLLEKYNLAENNVNGYQETIFTGDDN